MTECRITNPEKRTDFPYGLPLFRNGFALEFSDLTVISGENGSGKSTFLENLAQKLGYSVYGGTVNQAAGLETLRVPKETAYNGYRFHEGETDRQDVFSDSAALSDNMSLVFRNKFKTRNGYFLRAEHLQDLLAQLSDRSAYAECSHGEGLLKLFGRRMRDGVVILDEPETALSPMRQFDLARMIAESMRLDTVQYIVATHSPILMAIPGADFYYIGADGLKAASYKDSAHFKILRKFFEEPDRYMRHYLYDGNEGARKRDIDE